MTDKTKPLTKEDPNYPTLRESMREITGVVGVNPAITTINRVDTDEKGKRVFRKFKDGKGIVSETDQSKSEKSVVTS